MEKEIKGKIDGLILDVDGTLWDSTPIVARAWTNAICEKGGIKMNVTTDMLKALFGKTMTEIADRLLVQLEPEKRYALMEVCFEYEHKALEEDACDICYPGVIDTIKKLSQYIRLFIVSNCESGYIELFLKKTELGPYISDIECYGNTGRCKGDNIRLLTERNGLKHPVYVGDTQGDCDASQMAGIPFLFAAYGFGAADAMAGQIGQFSDLERYVVS